MTDAEKDPMLRFITEQIEELQRSIPGMTESTRPVSPDKAIHPMHKLRRSLAVQRKELE